jgi:hypothetical protein
MVLCLIKIGMKAHTAAELLMGFSGAIPQCFYWCFGYKIKNKNPSLRISSFDH